MIKWVNLTLIFLPSAGTFASEPVDYTRDIKPIFTKHCVECHSADKHRSGLRLDAGQLILKGGNSGAVVIAGKAAASKLVQAISWSAGAPKMPSGGSKISESEIAAIRAWIDQGAKFPADEKIPRSAKLDHWSFQPVNRPDPPAVKNPAWCRNAIDRFVLARLEHEGIGPSPEADRVTLIRRLYLDLLGLPPSPEEIDAFLADSRPDAYDRLVEHLLASPHYGERFGRDWLDIARYADSNGYSIDAARSIWPYRDWVIRAFNGDMPFDRFAIEQLAGDLLPNATMDDKVATGFHRNTPINQEGGIDLEQFRVDSIIDRLNTTGAAFLGLTVGCAQCHDHKFDPLTQREYYQLFAFLNNDDEPTLELGNARDVALKKKIHGERSRLEKQFKRLDKINEAAIDAWQGKLTPDMRARLPREIDHYLSIAVNGRDERQVDTLLAYVRNLDKTRHAVGGLMQPLPFAGLAHLHLLQVRNGMEARLADLRAREPNIPTTLVLKNRSTPRETHIHLGGDFTRKGVVVTPDTPAWLPVVPVSATLDSRWPTRLDFAQWLVNPANPLTPRVTVNRIWQRHFGLGLVETENDFGLQGTPPSHPELLDWLASEFVRGGWSMKEMHRLMVKSATYRQASKARPELALSDPRNRLLARMPRLRLDAEIVRDVGLAASGLLSRKIGGPSVFPPQPDGVFRFTQVPRTWKANVGPDRYRRGIYTFFWRSAPHPAMAAFDEPDGVNTCTRRNRSNTPLQALTLLNDEAFVEMAQGLASRVLREKHATDAERLERAFRLCLGRTGRANELERLAQLLTVQRQRLTEQETAKLAPAQFAAGLDRREFAAWETVARVLMNLDEFITRE